MESPSAFQFCVGPSPGLIHVAGEDRTRFLNGLVTQDLRRIQPGSGCYAAFTNAKGKMVGDAILLADNHAWWILTDAHQESTLAESIQKYLIADDVELACVGSTYRRVYGWGKIPVEDPAIHTWISSSEAGDCSWSRVPVTQPESFAIRRSMGGALIHECILPENALNSLLDTFRQSAVKGRGQEVSFDGFEQMRVEAGIPKWGNEMDSQTLPPEAGLDRNAVSYSKGCYLGQEVLARIKSIGHVNRTLVRMKLSHRVQPGSEVQWEEKNIGKVTSVVLSPEFGWIALGIIRREHSGHGTVVQVGDDATALVVDDFHTA